MLTICAIIAARNEAPYLRILLPILAAQGIEAAIIDNASTDDSEALYAAFAGNPIVSLRRLHYRGFFSLGDQLRAKQEVVNSLTHDWVIHHDADEVFEHHQQGLSLREAIEEADASGFNALNFDEFTFLPEAGADYTDADYHTGILRYYFFQPMPNRKNAAWKRAMGFDNTLSGGHQLRGAGLRIFPVNHVYRHYIVLSYEHAKQKYLGRSFDTEDLVLGWHGNRLKFTEENLRLPETSQYLFRLESYASREFRKDVPTAHHYWEW